MAWKNRKISVHTKPTFTYPPLPDGEWRVLLADPPWKYQNWTDKAHGAAKAWYATLTVEQIASIPVGSIAAEDSLLFLWVTFPKLKQGIEVMEAWGFEYVSLAFDWLKTYRAPFQVDISDPEAFHSLYSLAPTGTAEDALVNPSRVKTAWVIPGNMYCGLGFRTRQANEICLLGRKGDGVPKKSSSVLAPVLSQRLKHSEKPDEVYDRIEQLVDGPYIELFARKSRNGWSLWGDEAEDVAVRAALDEPWDVSSQQQGPNNGTDRTET